MKGGKMKFHYLINKSSWLVALAISVDVILWAALLFFGWHYFVGS